MNTSWIDNLMATHFNTLSSLSMAGGVTGAGATAGGGGSTK